MHQTGCGECDRLWREYSAATVDHVRLESKLRLAALRRDNESIEKLTRDVEDAGITRRDLRAAIRKHEATHDSADASQAGSLK